jgi:hypothetical protein
MQSSRESREISVALTRPGVPVTGPDSADWYFGDETTMESFRQQMAMAAKKRKPKPAVEPDLATEVASDPLPVVMSGSLVRTVAKRTIFHGDKRESKKPRKRVNSIEAKPAAKQYSTRNNNSPKNQEPATKSASNKPSNKEASKRTDDDAAEDQRSIDSPQDEAKSMQSEPSSPARKRPRSHPTTSRSPRTRASATKGKEGDVLGRL